MLLMFAFISSIVILAILSVCHLNVLREYSCCIKAKELNEELNKNSDVVLLNELDKKLNDSYEVYQLSNKKDEALERYISLKKIYNEDNEKVVAARLELKKAKEELNNYPLVKEYLEVYSRVRDLYLQINKILLDDFSGGE